MRDTYEHDREPLDEVVQDLAPVDRRVGAVFGVHGRLTGLELFDAQATLTAMLPKLVRSHALEALDPRRRAELGDDGDRLDLFLDAAHALRAEEYPAVGLGTEYRLHAAGLEGAALAMGGTVVHLSVLENGPTHGRFRHPR
jgi:hypothetical protein